LLAYTPKHVLFTAFLHLSCEEKLIEDKVCLLEVEDDVQFAHVAIVLVHLLDEAMDNLKGDKLVVGRVYSGDEEQRGVTAVDDFGVFEISLVYGHRSTRAARTNPCTRESCTF